MTSLVPRPVPRRTIAAYASIGTALFLVVVLGVWGAYRDVQLIRQTALQVELTRLQSHAIRTVGRIERSLEQYGEPDLERLRDEAWLPAYWQNILPHERQQLYIAIIDASGKVIMHSDPARQGEYLPRNWYERVVPEAGNNVFETDAFDGTGAYVIRIPIVVQEREIGDYLIGFDTDWFEQLVATHRNDILRRWGLIITAILMIVLLAVISLYYIASRAIALREAVSRSELRRASELSQLAAGLAHEVRNPLHAIKLNLHALRRVLEGHSQLNPEDVLAISEQSNEEIDRVDRLLKELLGFASPEAARNERLDLCEEVQSTADFLRQEMERKHVTLETQFSACPAPLSIDRGRLRQILINLLLNALDAVDPEGHIRIEVTRSPGHIQLSVSDDGHGVPETDRQRIFEPFYSQKEGGSGLGLALVRRFVQEARGQITCEANAPRGTRFRMVFPEAAHSPKARQKT